MEHMTEDEWYQQNSPQWTEIFSPFPDAGSFAAQFEEIHVDWTEFIGTGPEPRRLDTSSATSFTTSSSYALQDHDCACDDQDSSCELQCSPASGTSAATIGSQFPNVSFASPQSGSSSLNVLLNSSKRRIEPADRSPERPKRPRKNRLVCGIDGCSQDFACAYDRTRHVNDFHAPKRVYQCNELTCGYVRPRKDKVKSHCVKRKHSGFSAVDVAHGQNAEVLKTMHEQRWKKGKRKAACTYCGSRK